MDQRLLIYIYTYAAFECSRWFSCVCSVVCADLFSSFLWSMVSFVVIGDVYRNGQWFCYGCGGGRLS